MNKFNFYVVKLYQYHSFSFLLLKSPIAFFIASSASILQCNLTGGNLR